MSAMKVKTSGIEKQMNSPTTNSDYARQCIFVKVGKVGKYRQLHVTEEERVYYLTDTNRKTYIDLHRPIFYNSNIRAAGHSIWDGGKIQRHAGDFDVPTTGDLEEIPIIEATVLEVHQPNE